MTTGRVTATLKPLVPITILDSRNNAHTIQFVLDSEFNGQSLLPDRYIDRLGLSSRTGLTPALRPERSRKYPTQKP